MIDDDTNTRMKNGVDAACAVSVSRTKSPMAANTQNIAKPHTSAITYASTMPPKVPWNPKPTAIADERDDREQRRLAQEVGDGPSTDDGRARHRQRPEPLDQPRLRVLGEEDAHAEPVEDGDLREVAGDQVVDVRQAGNVDRPAEHVHEQQQEHHRLDDAEHEQLRRAQQVLDVAPGDHARVVQRGAARQTVGDRRVGGRSGRDAVIVRPPWVASRCRSSVGRWCGR